MKKILVIDDIKINLLLIKPLIKSHLPDYKVLTASSGKEGIEIARTEQPDTILLDIVMPNMDGFETCEKLKEDELTKHIPLILITAIKVDTKSKIKGLNIGADAFLSKPIDTIELVAQLKVMLRIKNAEDKLRIENEILEEIIDKRTQELTEKNKNLQFESIERQLSEQVSKKAEEEAIKSAHNLRTLFNAMSDLVVEMDYDGRYIEIAPTSPELLFKPAEELIGKTVHEIFPKSDADRFLSVFRKCLDKNKTYSIEYVLNINGKMTWFEGRAIPKTKNSVLFIARDITESKRATQIQKALHNISNLSITSSDTTDLFNSIKIELGEIIDTTNICIALYDDKTETITSIFFKNKKLDTISSKTAENLIKHVLRTKKALLATPERLKELVNSGVIDSSTLNTKIWLGCPLINRDKVIGVISVQNYQNENAFEHSDLKLLNYISSQISIYIDRKKVEQDLISALHKATESDRLKSVFLSTMSHELRTPLNSIIGFSELINDNLSVDEIINFVKIINSNGNHLLGVIENLFDITLIESGETKISKEKFKLESVLTDVHEIIITERRKAKKENIDLNLIIPNEKRDLIIHTDPIKLKQILINLLKNALKFTHQGHISYGFSIETDVSNQVLRFYVEDTGIGIPENKYDFIFSVFRQIEDSDTRKYGGTGVGLTISKKLIELLGGKIWIESEIGKGTVFYFTVPFKELQLPKKSIYPTREILNETDATFHNKTILVVDDDISSLKYLKVVFESIGAIVLWAENGEVAISQCKENVNIDLILMDINMPIMDGYEATRKIKYILPSIPIIAQTAYALPGDREKSIEAGCDDYIAKPIDRELLINILRKYLSINTNFDKNKRKFILN